MPKNRKIDFYWVPDYMPQKEMMPHNLDAPKTPTQTHTFNLALGHGAPYDPDMAYFVFSLCGLLCVSLCGLP